jgi:hypothetical protein
MDTALESTRHGLDTRGFIRCKVSLARVRPPYDAVLAAFRETCRRTFAGELHSLSLTGSVVNGTARPGTSDLDGLAILQAPPASAHDGAARQVARELGRRFPFLSDVSILIFGRDTILSEAERYDLGFFVKCLCACVDGEDLGAQLPEYQPTLALARGTNGNIRRLLADRRDRLAATRDPAEVGASCRGIMRKIVRTGFTLVMPRYRGWTSDLEPAATIFARYYPDQGAAMRAALALARRPSTDARPVLEAIDTLGAWLADEYDRLISGPSSAIQGAVGHSTGMRTGDTGGSCRDDHQAGAH